MMASARTIIGTAVCRSNRSSASWDPAIGEVLVCRLPGRVNYARARPYFRSISLSKPQSTALAYLSSSKSISNSPKFRVSGCPQNSPIRSTPVEVGEAEEVSRSGATPRCP
jgi:hypothetical protein